MSAPFDRMITGDAALFVALGIGFAFGWFLERGGMGDARRISGQFHFTNMAVLKLMFSAIVTAALGAFWLARAGWLDLSRVYIPETYLLPQAAGGLVFGSGFVTAGLCPGTSCVAAATGKLDGLAAMAGLLLGVLLVGAVYPAIAPFYDSTPRGALTVPALFGVPHGAALLALVALALGCFAGAARMERHAAGAGR
jgi:hypothetical protein